MFKKFKGHYSKRKTHKTDRDVMSYEDMPLDDYEQEKYPCIPITGMAKNTNNSRIKRQTTLEKKIRPAIPSPCKMLESVVSRYRKGQMKPRVTIK